MRRLMNFRTCCMGVTVFALVGLVLAPVAIAADDVQAPKTVKYQGKDIRVIGNKDVRRGEPTKAVEFKGEKTKSPIVLGKNGEATMSQVHNPHGAIGTPDAGLRDTAYYQYTFYEQANLTYYASDSWSWAGRYTLEVPGGGVPVVTVLNDLGIRNISGGTYVNTEVGILMEVYNEFDNTVTGTEPVHSTYLGGVFFPAGLDGADWATDSTVYLDYELIDPADFFFQLGDDNEVFISVCTGKIVSDVFVPTTANDDIVMHFGYGEALAPTVGSTDPTFYSDVNDDRIYGADEGPVWYGDDSYLMFTLRGTLMNDCNQNNYPDSEELDCGDLWGYPDCDSNGLWCVAYAGTSGLFQDPFGNGYFYPSECDYLVPTNGIPDVCDMADCDSNSIPDLCDISCDNYNPDGGALCSVDFPTTCGLGSDCDTNGTLDICQIPNDSATPGYCDPEISVCDPDCNGNGQVDSCELCSEPGQFCSDCNANGTLDGCEIASGAQPDCDGNGILDRCERPLYYDCNRNGQEDLCDIVAGLANDLNDDGVPDACAGETCENVWGGFEAFPTGNVDGYDSDGDEDTWTGGAEIVATGGCPTQALRLGSEQPIDFTNSEFFIADAAGNTPPPAPAMKLNFTYKFTGDENSTADHLMWIVDEEGNETAIGLRWTSANSLNEQTPWYGNRLYVFDSAVGEYYDTGVTFAHDVCYPVEIRLDAGAGTIQLWHGSPATLVYDGPTWDTKVGRLDWFQIDARENQDGAGTGLPARYLILDEFSVCESGGALDCGEYLLQDGSTGQDCDANGICDHFELEGEDLNNNGILDYCEGYCGDCNNNYIPDVYEIAAGSAADVNGNDIIDDCEFDFTGTTVFEDFSTFSVGTNAIGRVNPDAHGWTEYRGASEIANGGFGTGNFLKVKSSGSNNMTFIMSPRMANVADADIESWSWDMQMTSTDFGELYVEIMDMCEDGPTLNGDGEFIFLGDFIDAANTGLNWVTNNVEEFSELPEGNIRMRMLEDISAVGDNRTYENLLDVDPAVVPGQVVNDPQACGIRIINSRGNTEAYWANDHATLFDSGNKISDAPTETQGLLTIHAATIPKGGDKQLMISVADYGATNTTEFWFDNFTYETANDCDNDGTDDALQVAAVPGFDMNADGVPDMCQDCNADCVWSGPGGHGTACLDDAEITAGAPDCNGNGIPDYCDIDDTLPIETMWTSSSCYGSPAPAFNCYITRLGGGSLDLDGNLVPDDCDIAGGAADCNGNGLLDSVEIAEGTSPDNNGNAILDECEDDCNHNGIPDVDDLAAGLPTGSQDFGGGVAPDFDDIPDECCLIAVTGDMDADGDVDAADFKAMQWCAGQKGGDGLQPQGRVTGSAFTGNPWTGIPCGCADLNADGFVNETDMALFHYYITGPEAAPHGK